MTAPTAENVPFLSLRDQSADWSWQSVTPVPISNVFKSQFENTDIFNFQLSIFNFQFPLRSGAENADG